MYKFVIAFVMFFFVGCSQVTYNAQMCDKIAKDPTETIPQECVPYVEAEAEKASLNKKDKTDPTDSIEFTKE